MGSTQKHYEVIVVGAGMSGLSAATRMLAAGKKIIVLEGRDRVGGRMSAGNLLGQPVDLGAQWLEGIRNNPIVALCQQLNVTNVQTRNKLRLFNIQGDKISSKRYNQIETIAEKALAGTSRMVGDIKFADSLGKAIQWALNKKPHDKETLELVNWYLEAEIGSDEAANVGNISLSDYWNGEDTFSGGDRLFPGSYAELAQKYAAELPIGLNETVHRISQLASGVAVETNGCSYRADKVIVTLPLGVLKKNRVQFTPELPKSKRQAISSLGMGLANKVILRFPEVFWPAKTDYFGYCGTKPGEFCSWLNLYPYSGQAILSLWSHGGFAEELEQRSDQECVNAATTILKNVFGNKFREPVAYIVTRWQQDEFAGGSYSFLLPGSDASNFDELARPVDNKLFFAGEATESVHTATVHGAFLSGQRVAQEVINSK